MSLVYAYKCDAHHCEKITHGLGPGWWHSAMNGETLCPEHNGGATPAARVGLGFALATRVKAICSDFQRVEPADAEMLARQADELLAHES